jgi:hypothetical protein
VHAALPLQVNMVVASMAVFLDATTQAFKTPVCTISHDAITVMQFLIPAIAVFRIIYRFAEAREGSLMVLLAEVVLIILVSLVIGQLLNIVINATAGCQAP